MRNREIERVPFRSKLTKYRNIENRNKAFTKLTDRQKRQEIAFDALKLVVERKVGAGRGFYWSSELNTIRNTSRSPKELQEKLLNPPPSCEVCQRGLMMMAQIRIGNTVNPITDYEIANGTALIVKGFSMSDFRQMEREYEHFAFNHPYGPRTEEKLANICCNVIKNGNFNENDKTDYLKKWKLTIDD